jgi:hypothetical protein
LEVGIGRDGAVQRVTLWRRLTQWDEWRQRLPDQLPRAWTNPSFKVWDKTALVASAG